MVSMKIFGITSYLFPTARNILIPRSVPAHTRWCSKFPDLESATFEKVCSETLESLADYFEEITESVEHLKLSDINHGTYSDLKVVHSRIVKFVRSIGRFGYYQYGFKQKSNTKIIDDMRFINKELDDDNNAVTVFVDLRKAFGTVDTEVLVQGLEELEDGVITINLGKNYGSYVINRQTPNKQIWLSSPTSGPKRYDFVGTAKVDGGKWIYKHTGETLHELLQNEIKEIAKAEIDFFKLPYSKIG